MLRLLISLTIALSCRPGVNPEPPASQPLLDVYDLNKPNQTFVLPAKLKEISGLAYDERHDQLISINDEKGIVYFIDPNTGMISDKLNFHLSGDFEGISIIDSLIYAVRSNGNISRIKPNSKEKTYKTVLNQLNDVEGLCYQEQDHALLLACKARASHSNKQLKGNPRAIYAFDLEEKELRDSPFFEVQIDSIQNWLDHNKPNLKNKRNILGITQRSRVLSFAPSGIAIHPITKDYYILSARGKLLVILNQAFGVKHVELLDSRQHNQPEGICFDPQGRLFISNEGKHITSKIYRYEFLN